MAQAARDTGKKDAAALRLYSNSIVLFLRALSTSDAALQRTAAKSASRLLKRIAAKDQFEIYSDRRV
jgi:hypothetical protein